MSITSLKEFLAPMDPERFLCDIYRVKPAYISGESGRFAYLLPWDSINTIIAQHRLDLPRMRLAREGSVIEASKYLRNERVGASQLNLSSLNTQFREGTMLVIDSIDETYQPIAACCRMLERALGEYVHTNAYAGWYSTQGFATHWDDHDVIIVQVAGRKHWRVFEPSKPHPLEPYTSLNKHEAPTANPVWEGDLRSGDLLYIPRGWWHDAVPVGEPALHLTVSIPSRTGLSLMSRIIQRLRDYEAVRADLPRFASVTEQQRYMEEFRRIITDVMQEMTLGSYFRELDSLAQARVRPSFPWSAMPESQMLSQEAWLHWLPPRKLPIEEKEGKIVLEAIGSTFTFEKAAEPVLRNLAEDLSIRMDRLCANHPHIVPEAIGKFTLELVSKGLVTVAQEHHI